ncbi:MAG: hypothetical protein AVDCRST_MAG71-306 [uncultured Lysobacter sp.]|uniref:Uncharacterized protein n=1 Tax=uncultured Lysobacter sp. TaxID=271060 RepID=A0A6J4KGG3_9GAMM|nr:MAG: hypothetical protein AVDCRST_MAG71-306 [uncultured Lysobacter sp.]
MRADDVHSTALAQARRRIWPSSSPDAVMATVSAMGVRC